MSILTALKQAKGLGSGHNGTHHFIVQRLTAVMLIPLVLYFLYAIILLTGAKTFADVTHWFANPFNSGVLITFLVTAFYHAALGLQVVIEDYIHCEKSKWLLLIAVRGLGVLFAIIAVVSVLRLALAY
ncbi:succinate dehydrogenase, hydrophobic membrane anchor protein [Suttonella ornithocola]|uniref:Succinate dehydrogenase hydrophobic membrane anchor subunit n=1 Tax=Suttonella ornithocola TaxID=279832 RepID=A0A380MQV4_9GAMM|nr:succinate dehydrogenase, hydrophobic membrane anchor protein [Suttonella ornithocola]SUO94955.1 succinate dehydrogenase cytochrome b556 small membrane subunit [Suttonella ornithocola]